MLLADVAPRVEEESVELQYGEQMLAYAFHHEETGHLELVVRQVELTYHSVDNKYMKPLLGVLQEVVEVGDSHVTDDYPS